MALISKTSRLNRIPQLLNKKRDAEKDAQHQRDQRSDQQPSFSLKDKPSMKRPSPSPANKKSETERNQTAKSLREGIGRRVDLFV